MDLAPSSSVIHARTGTSLQCPGWRVLLSGQPSADCNLQSARSLHLCTHALTTLQQKWCCCSFAVSLLSTVNAGQCNKQLSVLGDFRLSYQSSWGLIFSVCKHGGGQSFVLFVAWQNYRVIKARRDLGRALSPTSCSKQNASVVFRHHLGCSTGTGEKGLLLSTQVVTYVVYWGLCSTIISALWFLAHPYNKNPIFADDFLQTSTLISS